MAPFGTYPMYVVGMNTVGMKCRLATEPSSPTYVTNVKSVSAQPSHSWPSLYLENIPPGMPPSLKQVIRPFSLLAPKPPRKYPLTERSPNFGLATGATGAAGGVSTGTGCCSAALGSSVFCRVSASVSWAPVVSSAKAGAERAAPISKDPDSVNDRNTPCMLDRLLRI